MNYIIPGKVPINIHEYNTWIKKHRDDMERYKSFLDDCYKEGYTEEKAKKLWFDNIGLIPEKKPIRFYRCYIIVSKVKMAVTVMKREAFDNSQREFEVIKLDKLILETYNYTKKMKKDESGKIIFQLIPQSLAKIANSRTDDVEKKNLGFIQDEVADIITKSPIDVVEEESRFLQNKSELMVGEDVRLEYYSIESMDAVLPGSINYEDSNWFNLLSINSLLDKLQVRVQEYQFQAIESKPKEPPKVFMQNLDCMIITDFVIENHLFKDKLYDQINEVFKRTFSKLNLK